MTDSCNFLIHFKEVNGECVDVVPGNVWEKHGTIEYDTGKFGNKCLKTINAVGYVQLANKTQPAYFNNQPFTVAFWEKCKFISPVGSVLWNLDNNDTNNRMILGMNNVHIDAGGADSQRRASATIICNGQEVIYANQLDDGINWHHFAFVGDGTNYRFFIDGILYGTRNIQSSPITDLLLLNPGITSLLGALSSYDNYTPQGLLDDFCIVDKALWTEDFTLPTVPLEFYLKKHLYIENGGGVYGVSDGIFEKLEDDYDSLTDSQKITIFNNITYPANISDIRALSMPINIEVALTGEYECDCTLYGVSNNQLVLSDTLIDLPVGKKINLVNIDANGNIKVAMTKDGNTYQVYNFTSKSWETIDIDEILTRGMNIGEIQAITAEKWEEYNPTQLGFAFYLVQENVEDVVEVSKIMINYLS